MNRPKNPSPYDPAELRKRYEYTSRVFPDTDSSLLLAEVLLSLGEVTQARRTISAYAEKKGDSASARLVLAKAHLMCWKTASAEKELKKALELEPENTEASRLLMEIYKSVGKFAEAASVVASPRSAADEASGSEKLASEGPARGGPRAGTFETITVLNLYVAQGLYEEALQMIEVLCGREPHNADYRRRREEITALAAQL